MIPPTPGLSSREGGSSAAGEQRPPGCYAMARLDVTEVIANIRLPGHLHTKSSLQFASNFEFQDTDVLLVTYPKSGTTWMQEILTLIHSNGDLEPIKTLPNWARAPWLEHSYFQEQLQHIGCPRLLTTHLPQPVLVPALKKAKPKVIYVTRNPKDVAVSYYHFQRMAKFFPDPASFEGFLHDFMAGTVHYGSWFEHVKGWLSCREELGLFCITYEELHQDLKHCVEQLSAFLDHPVQPNQVKHILEHCSFAVMKDNVMVNCKLVPPEIMDFQKSQFMRKGIVGDWRNHFSPKQSALFNEKYQQEMGAIPGPSSGTWTESSCSKTSADLCKGPSRTSLPQDGSSSIRVSPTGKRNWEVAQQGVTPVWGLREKILTIIKSSLKANWMTIMQMETSQSFKQGEQIVSFKKGRRKATCKMVSVLGLA